MRDERARQRRFERKKRRREERRRALREVVAQPTRVRGDCRVFATDGSGEPLPPGVETWPIVRAYVPSRNVWEATGLGTAGVVRQQPDGRYVSAFFVVELLEHGLKGAFGGRDETLAKIEEDLVHLSDNFPICEEGPVELAASFAWGARALADAEGYPFPARDTDRFYGLMPRPPGSHGDWVAKLVGPGGLTPQDLVRVIRANPQPDDLPDGKEVVILTEMTFAIPDAGVAVDALRRASPEFHHDGRAGGADAFTWTRPYPRDHGSPLSSLGGRQILGSVQVRNRELVADAKTLSMAAKMVGRLERLLDGRLDLQGSRWMGMQNLLAREEARPTGAGRTTCGG
ncbi:MAG TPA: hypothetical protein VMK12_01425 [Anaeromyxobacteraceae bacterium]|nr:hypothetical protein [Anaeromyxobacteraceae bacterium]